jgi:hypothetical protein
MNILKKSLICFLLAIIFFNPVNNYLYCEENKTESKEELLQKIDYLDKLINEKFFVVQKKEAISNAENIKYFTGDRAALRDIKLKLFYSFGKIYGYAVFIGNNNEFAIIDNVNLKITLHNKKFVSGKKTFYYKINRDKFSKLTLSRGDIVIAFPIENVEYGDKLEEGTVLPVDVECFHVKSRTKIYIY